MTPSTLYPDNRTPLERVIPEPPPVGSMTWAGQPGGILVIGERPVRGEREPFDSKTGQALLAALARLAPGVPVAYDYAFRTGYDLTGKKADAAHMTAARTQLHHTIQQVKPTRVLVFGQDAHKAVTGQAVQSSVVRKTHGFLSDGTPVFHLPRPWGAVVTNRILRKWYLRDLENAATCPAPTPPFDGTWREVLTVADAETAYLELAAAGCWVFDTETFGAMHTPHFRVVVLAACAPGSKHAWVWDQDALRPDDPRAQVVLRLMREVPCAGHNLKYDSLALWYHFGERPAHERWCTRLLAKLRRADGPAGLDPQAALVGMGGHKLEAREAKALAQEVLTKLRTEAHQPIAIAWADQEYTTPKGNVRTRKVVTATRPPTPTEVDTATRAAWTKARTRRGVKTTVAQLTGLPEPTPDWLLAVSQVGTEPGAWVYGLMDRTVCKRYCARDTVTTALLLPWVRGEVARDPGLQMVWDEILGDATHAVAGIEKAGLLVNGPAMDALEAKLDQMVMDSWAVISRYTQPGFNPDSGDQVAALLFGPAPGGLGLPPGRLTDTGKPATDSKTLQDIAGRHPVVPALLDYKKATKLQSNYARGMRRFIAPDGRVHCTLNIDGTESGRLSASSPNLQTIPSRGSLAKLVKRVFCAPAGRKLVQIDYSTLELRVLAMLANEQAMIDLFKRGVDLHRQTAIDNAQLIWGSDFYSCGLGYTLVTLLQEHGCHALAEYLLVHDQDTSAIGDPSKGWTPGLGYVEKGDPHVIVTPDGQRVLEPRWSRLVYEQGERRKAAKGVNFATAYGQGPETLAENWGLDVDIAHTAQEAIMGSRPAVQRWIRETIKEARKVGFTRTAWNGKLARIRPLPDLDSGSRDRSGHAERAAYNTQVQGSGSDYCLASVVRLTRLLEQSDIDARIVLTVHDSIIFECADRDVPRLVQMARQVMTGWYSADVPITVDVEVGQTWGDMEPYRG
jgi:DNA polymerase I-like protein with 3'-5' exonuclease and polymerase domains/uracil-DNA glycosylase